MPIEFTPEEILFIYGRIKKEFISMESQKTVRYSKSELKFYEDLIAKLENAYPTLVNLPL